MITIIINGFEWKVHFVSQNHDELTDDNGKPSLYGVALMRECEIYIDGDLPKGLMEKIVTHELVHAVAYSYDVDLDNVDEEKMCDFIWTYFDAIKLYRDIVLEKIR